MAKLLIMQGKGLHLTFDNGWTLSIQIGPGNYGDNYDMSSSAYYEQRIYQANLESTQAEIAMWKQGGDMVQFPEGDTVRGYVPINEILDLINEVRAR